MYLHVIYASGTRLAGKLQQDYYNHYPSQNTTGNRYQWTSLFNYQKLQRLRMDAIVVFVDRLSKYAYFEVTTTTATAEEIAEIFFKTIFRHHGLPTTIVCDRDSKFTSNFWKALFSILNTKIAYSTAYHPQTDGQTERMNQMLEQYLRMYIGYKQTDWDKWLTQAEFAINNAKQASTGMSPFYLNYGRHPETPTTLSNPEKSPVPAAENFTRHMADLSRNAKEALARAQQNQKKYSDQHRRDESFELGDRVLLSNSNIQASTQKKRPTKKLQPKFF